MGEEIYVNVREDVSRVAVTEQGLLREIYTERTNHRSTLGNIYKGKVTRVLPAIDGAFVDIGNDRDAFIQFKDLMPRSSVLFERSAQFYHNHCFKMLKVGRTCQKYT